MWTPRGHLSKLEQDFLNRPGESIRSEVEVKLLPRENEIYVLAESRGRVSVEQAFKDLKQDLSIRPVFHQKDVRIDAHIFAAFPAYCLHVTLKHMARQCASGLTPGSILEKFKTIQMIDVTIPTVDGRIVELPRYTQPDKDLQPPLHQLRLTLPAQPNPKVTREGKVSYAAC